MAGFEPWNETLGRRIISAQASVPGAMLPILQELQAVFGYVPDEAAPILAEALNLSRAEVFGVLTFYHDFRRTPPGRHELKICRAEACQARGGRALAKHATEKLGIGFGETSDDGKVSLEAVYCLGLCASAPSAMLDGRLVSKLTRAKLDALIVEARK